MQPYINPNYFSFMAQQNPYARLDQMQAPQFQTLGKVVESVDMVKATDIPMDGNTYYFLKADGTELFSKQWLPNGQTRILTFKPLLDSEPNNMPLEYKKSEFVALDELKTALFEKMESINDRLDKIDNIIRPTPTSKSKKEVAEND